MARTTPLLKNRSTRLERGSACDSGIRDGHARFGTSVFGSILNRHRHIFPLPCWSPDRPHLSGYRRKRPELAGARHALGPFLCGQVRTKTDPAGPASGGSDVASFAGAKPSPKGSRRREAHAAEVAQHQKFFALPLKLFLGFQIFLSPQTWRPGRLRGPEIKAGAGGCPVPARTQLAL